MKEGAYGEDIDEKRTGPQSDSKALDGEHEGLETVRGGFENVGPHKVEQVLHAILTCEPKHAQRQLSHSSHRDLAVHQISTAIEMVEGYQAKVLFIL